VKSRKLLLSFFAYCVAHPQERFWQALRNWSGVHSVLVTDGNHVVDTFYLKNNKSLPGVE
jgi:hypothetical protein